MLFWGCWWHWMVRLASVACDEPAMGCMCACCCCQRSAWLKPSPLHSSLGLYHSFPSAPSPCSCHADPTVALLCTDLLESSRFDPELVKWLLDRGAGVAVPPPPHSSLCGGSGMSIRSSGMHSGCGCGMLSGELAPCTPPSSSTASCSFSSGRGELPATAVALRKLAKELHVSRQLSKLHVAACAEQERWLLRRAADCLTLLLAAGATPVGATSNAALAAAAAALEPADWEAVRQVASKPPEWTPRNHSRLFPAAYCRTAQEVLKLALRGFTVPTAASCQPSGSEEQRHSQQQQQQELQQRCTFFLDGNVVQCIIQQLAPCSQR